jgi:hypothetical protein
MNQVTWLFVRNDKEREGRKSWVKRNTVIFGGLYGLAYQEKGMWSNEIWESLLILRQRILNKKIFIVTFIHKHLLPTKAW